MINSKKNAKSGKDARFRNYGLLPRPRSSHPHVDRAGAGSQPLPQVWSIPTVDVGAGCLGLNLPFIMWTSPLPVSSYQWTISTVDVRAGLATSLPKIALKLLRLRRWLLEVRPPDTIQWEPLLVLKRPF